MDPAMLDDSYLPNKRNDNITENGFIRTQSNGELIKSLKPV